MPIKVTMLFQQANASTADQTLQMTGGWSETMWCDLGSPTAALDLLQAPGPRGMLTLRKGVLSHWGTIQAIRAQEYSIAGPYLIPTGNSLVRDVGQPGTWAAQRDHPHLSLLISLGFIGGQGGRIRYRLGGVPDTQCVGGEALFAAGYRQALDRYLAGLGAWGSVVRVRTGNPRFKIATITANVLTGRSPLAGFAVNDWVRIDRTKITATGRLKGGLARVLTDGMPANIALSFWSQPDSTGGSVSKYQRGYVPFDNTACRFVKVVRRDIGAPFSRWRGRRSKRQ